MKPGKVYAVVKVEPPPEIELAIDPIAARADATAEPEVVELVKRIEQPAAR